MKVCVDVLADWNLRLYVTKIINNVQFLIWQPAASLAQPKAACVQMCPYYLTPV